MKSLDFGRCMLGMAAALLAGCGGTPGGTPGAVPLATDPGNAVTRHKTFHYTGGKQTFTVPDGVTKIKVVALGGNGANWNGVLGGYGGLVSATFSVTPHEQLIVYVGGNASGETGGFNGGGSGGAGPSGSGSSSAGAGGGGASDVRTDPGKLSDRVVVAAGGGGAGSGGYGNGSSPASGGEGGDRTGGSGGSSCPNICGGGGAGGTQKAGGSGGDGGSGSTDGGDGARGLGGSGGSGVILGSPEYEAGGGGGAGGGYYGGGGGGGGSDDGGSYGSGGGGGGGSSYVKPTATGGRMWEGWKAAQRVVVLYW